jgi:hypothetical protein
MSKIEVNQISSQCGSTLTIGQSGDTVTLACGATQTGFGRTGTVDWCTTAKTAPFTGVSGNGYFVNTTCGAVTVTLPATPSAGDIISIKDYARTAATNNISICRNGSKMDGVCASGSITTDGDSTTLIYVDGTKGWTSILDNTTTQYGEAYITATGGTITTCGDYKIHTFTSDSTFTVCSVGNPAGSTTVDYLVVAGAGAGGTDRGGGGGAGGMRFSLPCGITGYPASPLNAGASIPVSVTSYPITVGSGGAAAPNSSCVSGSGTNSVFSTITSAGGGGADNDGSPGGVTGGSGGGGSNSRPGLAGNTPPTSPAQGTAGGNADGGSGGGGGGGGLTAGTPGNSPGGAGGGGGGYPTIFGTSNGETCGSFRYFSGGGGGGNLGTGGLGGGGSGGTGTSLPAANGTSGTANTGGGGGGGGTWPINNSIRAGNGGSGIVVITYKYQ